MNNEPGVTWHKAVVVYFKVLNQNLQGQGRKTTKRPDSGTEATAGSLRNASQIRYWFQV
jgi:hypothetical protein